MTSVIPSSIVIPFRLKGDIFEVWMQKRKEAGSLNNLWEFPGGKIEAGEDAKSSGARELLEETGKILRSEELVAFKNYVPAYTDRNVILFVHLGQVDEMPDNANWFVLEDLKNQDGIIEINKTILSDLEKYLNAQKNYLKEDKLWQSLV